MTTTFRVPTSTGDLVGTIRGQGPGVLLLHGGPGLEDYLGPLAEELAPAWTVATYTQRGVAPSTEAGAVTVASHVADVLAVLRHLGWKDPVLGGHSWGGNLTMHVLAEHPDAARAGLVVDPLGAVGDGGMEEFGAELMRRLPDASRPRVDELNAIEERDGSLPPELAAEHLRLVWPAYFPEPDAAPPMPPLRASARFADAWTDMMAQLPGLADQLRGCAVPTVFVHGARSPMPLAASTESADLFRNARVEVVDGAGHFVWMDRPGAVRSALDSLV